MQIIFHTHPAHLHRESYRSCASAIWLNGSDPSPGPIDNDAACAITIADAHCPVTLPAETSMQAQPLMHSATESGTGWRK